MADTGKILALVNGLLGDVKSEITNQGFSVVDGKLCITYETEDEEESA